jgi:hypothetical protein
MTMFGRDLKAASTASIAVKSIGEPLPMLPSNRTTHTLRFQPDVCD